MLLYHKLGAFTVSCATFCASRRGRGWKQRKYSYNICIADIIPQSAGGVNRVKAKKIILIVCLALLCVFSTELAFCASADPELFQNITAPAVSLAQRVQRSAAEGARRLGGMAREGAAALRSYLSITAELEPAGAQAQTLKGPPVPEPPPEPEPPPPPVTQLVRNRGREVLTGGVEIVYYNQKDEAWAEASFGGDPVGIYGCGPTALAMAVSSMTDVQVDPAEMAEWCAGEGYRAPKSGSYLTIVNGVAEHYGLTCASLPLDQPQALLDGLAGGGVAVALMGPGHFTEGGHFILLHGVTPEGLVLAADPNSRDNSLVPWDPQLILSELSTHRSGGSPLWLLQRGPAPRRGRRPRTPAGAAAPNPAQGRCPWTPPAFLKKAGGKLLRA